MTDQYSQEKRSEIMRRVRNKNTRPEMLIRRLIHSIGYRYRLHRKDLPGKPDLVFPSRKKIIFVHGCFWHGHSCKRGNRIPKNNHEYWVKKIFSNKERDKVQIAELELKGWLVLVVWECQIHERRLSELTRIITEFLD